MQRGVRTAGNAVEKHTCPKPHARALSRRGVWRGVCAPTRVRQAPARGRPRVVDFCGSCAATRPALDSVQQCVWAAVTWRLGWALPTPSASPPARALRNLRALGESRSAGGAGSDGSATFTPRPRHTGASAAQPPLPRSLGVARAAAVLPAAAGCR